MMLRVATFLMGILSSAFIAQDYVLDVPVERMNPELESEAPWNRTSSHVIPLIAKWEGKRNEAYLDEIASPPIWTICYGHTATARPGMVLSDKDCEKLLRDEVQRFWRHLRPAFTDETLSHRMPPTRDAAYTSLAYNVGVAGVTKSTAVRRLNSGNIAGGCAAITWWNKAGGRVVRGLVNRRVEEHELCLKGLNTSG